MFLIAIANVERRMISAMTLLEAHMVMFGKQGTAGVIELERLLSVMAAEVIPFDAKHAEIAFNCFCRFGKGIHSTARLNFGDCAAYALAKSLGAPLLYKGGDFAATDIAAAAT